jgi:hypothetical protein
VVAFALSLFQTGYAGADTYRISPPSLELKICKSSVCNNIPLPLLENSENPTYSLRDFDNDGIPEVIVTEDPQLSQGINVTSFIYRIEKNNLILIKTNTGDDAAMGNISFHKDKIISSYRSGPIWYQDIYHYSHGVFVREMQDRSGELRTIFNEKGEIINEYMIVNFEMPWWERKKLSATISSSKAKLFDAPNPQKHTNMYLVAGDRVVLKNVEYSDEGGGNEILFYKIECLREGKPPIHKWVEADSLKLDD